MSQNVIELNGKRYDAITGAFLGKSTADEAAPLTAPRRSGSGRALDGVIRSPKTRPNPKPAAKAVKQATTHHVPAAAKATTAVVHQPAPVQQIAKQEKVEIETLAPAAVQPHHAEHSHAHTPAKHLHRHAPQHTRTLVRSTVHRPETHMKPAIKPQAPAEVMAKPVSAIAAKRSASQVDPDRLARASAAMKHSAVRRFHAANAGIANATHHGLPQAAGSVPVIAVQPHPVEIAERTAPAKPADIFENAIRQARSHEQPAPRRRFRHRTVNILAGVAALLILSGFITWLNLPNIQLHIASMEAGFHASMPDYMPNGYALRGGIHHSGGTVSMQFYSGDSSFQITQQSSNWDSQALLDNTLALSGPHQTVQRNGRIVYVYGEGANASWVTGNVRYDITGNASLNADELARIAASM